VQSDLVRNVLDIALEAGALALQYREGRVTSTKIDGSPVTDADVACDALIRSGLSRLGSIPIVSEETAASHDSTHASFWLVDPLDGTKEYIRGSGEFTVNIALVESGRTVLGVVHAPALALTYFASRGNGAFRRSNGDEVRIAVSAAADPIRVAVSRDHVGAGERELLAKIPGARVVPMGSSLKFCLVADGSADLYPRLGPTREWDTAAAQCVVEEAGGHVVGPDRAPLRYGKPDLLNPSLMTYGLALPPAIS
jgi:3'(2'), 5'-bisphosphate nucleotidase